jgi:peptidoglycan/LPS O-acetylase OafA/YrhL
LLYIFSYTAVNSKVGESKFMEQLLSNITMLSIILVFILKRFELKLLTILGIYSYEIYLLHWPLVYRYDFLYQILPASIATIIYIGLLIIIGLILQKLSEKIAKIIRI